MARRKAKQTLPASTSELAADPHNPRSITDEARAALAASLEKFGDLSGIVYNLARLMLVTGHQRLNEIRRRWGEAQIEVLDARGELGVIRIDEQHEFPVRVVNWPKEKHVAAAIAANNLHAQGVFSDSLGDVLRPVDTAPPPAMTWVLVGIPTPRYGEIAETIASLATLPEIVLESTVNDG